MAAAARRAASVGGTSRGPRYRRRDRRLAEAAQCRPREAVSARTGGLRHRPLGGAIAMAIAIDLGISARLISVDFQEYVADTQGRARDGRPRPQPPRRKVSWDEHRRRRELVRGAVGLTTRRELSSRTWMRQNLGTYLARTAGDGGSQPDTAGPFKINSRLNRRSSGADSASSDWVPETHTRTLSGDRKLYSVSVPRSSLIL
jgi:hypothetical protein